MSLISGFVGEDGKNVVPLYHIEFTLRGLSRFAKLLKLSALTSSESGLENVVGSEGWRKSPKVVSRV